ncbi:tetratricopeptide repeat protein [Pelodictyon phaeoclathratiforme]|uniref:Tol-pal system protein YbgF n=1 Tax=Pelodictyon phaeoclathratiforme (strain DSM 5477 / BU-1) TaxID=324925 RepID=B4SDA2_PELPB|nr:outer membrane protein assembly factor BamD [Pelodictyon phaeoclathratiforme]ACF44361.1 tol-pal system protein YbgF [Pelodictyon phaeoclathratiforme BU-1]
MKNPLLTMYKKIRPFLFLPVLALSACASKQDLLVVEDNLKKLKTDSETIKSQSAVSYSDVQQVRDDVSRLQGSIEEISHNNRLTFGRLGMEDSLLVHKVDELELRLQKMEQYIALAKEQSPPSAAPLQQNDTVQSAQKPSALTDAALLEEGRERLKSKNYVASRESFGLLMQRTPPSALADQAQFFIAESYFGEKWYEKAILEYQVVIAKYLKSNKRPEALYKQALSFEFIGDPANAKARFKDLVNVYPDAPQATQARKKLQ